MIACTIGINRASWQSPKVHYDMIPVDICIKGMVTAIVKHGKLCKKGSLQVFNATSVKTPNVVEMIKIGKKNVTKEVPPNMMFWRPGGKVTPYVYEFYLRVGLQKLSF